MHGPREPLFPQRLQKPASLFSVQGLGLSSWSTLTAAHLRAPLGCVELFPSPGSCWISCYFVLPLLLGFPFTFIFSGVLCLLHFSPPLCCSHCGISGICFHGSQGFTRNGHQKHWVGPEGLLSSCTWSFASHYAHELGVAHISSPWLTV